jgi:hypothetical protein
MLAAGFMFVSGLVYSSTLKIGIIYFSDACVVLQRPERRLS